MPIIEKTETKNIGLSPNAIDKSNSYLPTPHILPIMILLVKPSHMIGSTLMEGGTILPVWWKKLQSHVAKDVDTEE